MESIDSLISDLINAFDEYEDDPISLAASIEMHSDQLNSDGKTSDKEKFLEALLKEIKSHPQIAAKISWDLPKEIFKFFTVTDIDINQRLGYSVIISLVMKCFNEISLSGNPKDCLLTGCEILSGLSLENENLSLGMTQDSNKKTSTGPQYAQVDTKKYYMERTPADFFVTIKMHILFELIGTTLKRINTIYPSKYLRLATSSMLQFVRVNSEGLYDIRIVMRRLYGFCRGYISPEHDVINTDENIEQRGKIAQEELEEITRNEEVLQAKILRNFCTAGLQTCLKATNDKSDAYYYHKLLQTECQLSAFYKDLVEINSRFYNLALSFDIDTKEEFLHVLEESSSIYKGVPKVVGKGQNGDIIKQVVHKLSYSYELQKITKEKGLYVDPFGIVLLSAFHYMETGNHLYPEIHVQDAIYLYLRCVTPSFYSDFYTNLSVEGVARYWLWVSITRSPSITLKEEISELPEALLSVFLETLLLKNCTQNSEETRMITFTLLTRLSCLVPEEIAFEFLSESLASCPYPHGKSCALGILKDLMSKNQIHADKADDSLSQVTEQVMNLSISVSGNRTPKNKTITDERPYIRITDERMTIVHRMAMADVEKVNDSKVRRSDLILIINYLEYFIGLCHKWDKKLLLNFSHEVGVNLSGYSHDSDLQKKLLSLNKHLDELISEK
ncbi:Ybp1p NDAI_0F01800 [Naumovozyma dairenensis CBS 421]|uniref:YAP1 binding protein 2 n=1 Tax=Naumovozyma dairenensis (strain ATCC 10597 / BCRC 20456 / CBS 421 / NBRC 0211 / NRRL Y-12639) TaxID=1071378 RepID=G0WCI8_NAUDC|nr:hypothetical protein NDAI_0F01800 [Naumovozyma dairenensis CBS 421]CCD25499.1 hypothetical protein NDAI_0F01800 [Naumovozyma dairenensis CBS 421]